MSVEEMKEYLAQELEESLEESEGVQELDFN